VQISLTIARMLIGLSSSFECRQRRPSRRPTDAGFVFVSINHRLLPSVDMGAITRDVASALGWVHRNIATHGGDPTRLLVMGHSSGGQHASINDNIVAPNDPVTKELFAFVAEALKR
jgi:carboxylesterase type B